MERKSIFRPAVTLAIATGIAMTAHAQVNPAAALKAISIGPYAEAGYPTGKMADIRNTGFGIGLAADIRLPLLPVSLSASAGYMGFAGKAIPGQPGHYESLQGFPLRAAVRWSKGPFYIVLESGSVSLIKGGNGTSALLAPGIGVRILKIDIRGKYETWFRSGEAQFFAVQGSFKF
jgi:hypothetical protein